MQSHGWRGLPLPPGKHNLPPPYDPSASDANKVWYFHGSRQSIPAVYLRSLLAATSLIEHARTPKEYRALLARDGEHVLAIEDEIG
eukprot:4270160-Pyramimonas_sp.AAC.1